MIPKTVFFEAADLLPDAWRHLLAAGPVQVFNPGLLRDGAGWLFAYRVVGPDGARRIGLCRLDASLRVVPGSALSWSDGVRFESRHEARVTGWFADPRLYRLGGGLWIYWNSGWHDPENRQFLQAIDPATLQPIGRAREMVLRGRRQPIEKNWTLFETGRPLALYAPWPLRVLAFSLQGEGDIEFVETGRMEGNGTPSPGAPGALRGGAPPQRVGDAFFGIGHTVGGPSGHHRYVAAAYRFSAEPPFRLTGVPAGPLALGPAQGESRRHARLNPAVAEVVYPCGAAYEEGAWFVSFGLNDERCAVSLLAHADLTAALRPVTT